MVTDIWSWALESPRPKSPGAPKSWQNYQTTTERNQLIIIKRNAHMLKFYSVISAFYSLQIEKKLLIENGEYFCDDEKWIVC